MQSYVFASALQLTCTISEFTQDQKLAELQVWEESVPMLRSMLEEAMEQKAQLQAEKEDCTRLRQGLALTWVPDSAVHKCLNCEVVFGLRKWKNHCRYCSVPGCCALFGTTCYCEFICCSFRCLAGTAAVSSAGTVQAASSSFGA